MKMMKTMFIAFGVIALASCDNGTNTGNTKTTDGIVDMHTSEIALDWHGSYYGLLPCADCAGIETVLRLNLDQTYELTQTYLTDKDNGAESKYTGKFTWDDTKIKLEGIEDGSTFFKVEEGRVIYLDMEGNQVEGELADHYILTKEGNPEVEDIRWQLIEVGGKPVVSSAPETHYIIFHSEDNKLEAKADCNVILSPYSIRNQFRLSIKQGITTLMACPDNTEDRLVKVLLESDNIAYKGDTLSLNKARMGPLARFVKVK